MDERIRRRHERDERIWRKHRNEVLRCPDCHGARLALRDMFGETWRKYVIECEDCGWENKGEPTIKLAIRAWNLECAKHGNRA